MRMFPKTEMLAQSQDGIKAGEGLPPNTPDLHCHQQYYCFLVPLTLPFVLVVASVLVAVPDGNISALCKGVRLANYCVDFHFNKPVIIIGVMMLVIGLIGCIAFCCKNGRAAAAYFVFQVVVFIYMIVVMITWSIYTRYSPAALGVALLQGIPTRPLLPLLSPQGYRWDQIANCLAPSDGRCAQLDHTTTYNNSSQQFFNAANLITPLAVRSGVVCRASGMWPAGYTFVSPTNWTSSTSNQTNVDCAKWNVDPIRVNCAILVILAKPECCSPLIRD
ncbi:unnamed protein product [Cuscuta campestris]|uniref:Uncharacterized protein n=1 Tax=Cuscuta campestris TaxID=132261 RepID=A0A484MTH9_9ASTE|nr:unnamed protein product [Cuscuta campestris]